MQEFKNWNLDVAIVSKTKKKENGTEKVKDYKHFFSGVGKDQRAKAGILILIHKKYENYIKSWEAYSERFIKVTILLRETQITILRICSMSNDYSLQEKESFEKDFRKILNEIRSIYEIICEGNFNASVAETSTQ